MSEILGNISKLLSSDNLEECYKAVVANKHQLTPDLVIGDLSILANKLINIMSLEKAQNVIIVGKDLITQIDSSKITNLLDDVAKIYESDAKIAYLKGEIDNFLAKSQENHEFYFKYNYYTGLAGVESNVGIYYWKKGENRMALEYLQRSVEYAELSNDKRRIGISLNNRGITYQANNMIDEAITDHKKAMEIQIEYEHLDVLPSTINSLGWVYVRIGKLNNAHELFLKAIKIAEENNIKKNLSNYLANIGFIHQLRGEVLLAEQYYLKQLDINLELDNEIELGQCYQNLGEIEREKENVENALEFLMKAKEIRERKDLKDDLMKTLTILFELSLSTKRPTAQILDQIEGIYRSDENPFFTQIYKYCTALKAKSNQTISGIANAQTLFTEIIQDETVYFEIKIQSTLNLCEILIFEYKAFQNPAILDRINSILNELENETLEEQLYSVYIQIILLKTKIELVNSDFEKAKIFLDTVGDFCEAHGLKLYSNLIQEEKWKYIKQKDRIRKFSKELHEHENKYAIDDLSDYFEAIITKSFEYKNQITSFHFERGEMTLCGIQIEQLRMEEREYGLSRMVSSKCGNCNSEYSKQILKEILKAHIVATQCNSCQIYPTNSQASELIRIYELNNQEKQFDAFLKVQVPFKDGEIQWNCFNSKCDNKSIFQIELNSIQYI